MTVKTKSTNVQLHTLIRTLKMKSKENNAKIWRYLVEILEKPKRKRVAVNISKINRYSEKGETVVVPGKVLGTGELKHPVTVAAFKFSLSAKEKIIKAGGKTITITELLESNPSGSGVKILI
ncbi:MAG: 50S ribosomal protein L18e [Candidatus Njordarchaeia archaeon]